MNGTNLIIDTMLKTKDLAWAARAADFISEASEYATELVDDQGVVTGWICPESKLRLVVPHDMEELV